MTSTIYTPKWLKHLKTVTSGGYIVLAVISLVSCFFGDPLGGVMGFIFSLLFTIGIYTKPVIFGMIGFFLHSISLCVGIGYARMYLYSPNIESRFEAEWQIWLTFSPLILLTLACLVLYLTPWFEKEVSTSND